MEWISVNKQMPLQKEEEQFLVVTECDGIKKVKIDNLIDGKFLTDLISERYENICEVIGVSEINFLRAKGNEKVLYWCKIPEIP